MIGTTTIGKLAKTWGMARNTLWRRLMVLHRDHPEGGWLVRRSSTWSVNVTMLRKFHPELFQQPSTKDFSIRLLSLESTVKLGTAVPDPNVPAVTPDVANVNAPVFANVASPDNATGEATLLPLPTKIFVEANVEVNLLLNVVKSADAKAPRFVADAD